MKTTTKGRTAYPSLLALGLLIAVVNATALTQANPPTGPATRSSATTATSPNTLTPTAPASFPASLAAEDSRDSRPPRHLPQPWFWWVVAVGVLALVAGAGAVWHWVRHGKFFVLAPPEIAEQGLDEARCLMHPSRAADYCFAVSQIIRNYLEQQFQLKSPQMPTWEFFDELVADSKILSVPLRTALGDFLQQRNLVRRAARHCNQADLVALHDSAIRLVQQTDATRSRLRAATEQIHNHAPSPQLGRAPAG
jgi:hypothetical protein